MPTDADASDSQTSSRGLGSEETIAVTELKAVQEFQSLTTLKESSRSHQLELLTATKIERHRERAAERFAVGLVVVFAGTVLSPVAYVLMYRTAPPAEFLTYGKDVAALEATLLAAIAGFYFSQKRLT